MSSHVCCLRNRIAACKAACKALLVPCSRDAGVFKEWPTFLGRWWRAEAFAHESSEYCGSDIAQLGSGAVQGNCLQAHVLQAGGDHRQDRLQPRYCISCRSNLRCGGACKSQQDKNSAFRCNTDNVILSQQKTIPSHSVIRVDGTTIDYRLRTRAGSHEPHLGHLQGWRRQRVVSPNGSKLQRAAPRRQTARSTPTAARWCGRHRPLFHHLHLRQLEN